VQPNLERRGKLVVGALMIGILALSITALQQRFDEGDFGRAIAMLAAKPDGGRSINEEMVARAGSAPVGCDPRLLSSLRGTLEVTCTAGVERYRFKVDLVRKRVEAEDPHTQGLIDAVDAGS
jgi:hypothetical protein